MQRELWVEEKLWEQKLSGQNICWSIKYVGPKKNFRPKNFSFGSQNDFIKKLQGQFLGMSLTIWATHQVPCLSLWGIIWFLFPSFYKTVFGIFVILNFTFGSPVTVVWVGVFKIYFSWFHLFWLYSSILLISYFLRGGGGWKIWF